MDNLDIINTILSFLDEKDQFYLGFTNKTFLELYSKHINKNIFIAPTNPHLNIFPNILFDKLKEKNISVLATTCKQMRVWIYAHFNNTSNHVTFDMLNWLQKYTCDSFSKPFYIWLINNAYQLAVPMTKVHEIFFFNILAKKGKHNHVLGNLLSKKMIEILLLDEVDINCLTDSPNKTLLKMATLRDLHAIIDNNITTIWRLSSLFKKFIHRKETLDYLTNTALNTNHNTHSVIMCIIKDIPDPNAIECIAKIYFHIIERIDSITLEIILNAVILYHKSHDIVKSMFDTALNHPDDKIKAIAQKIELKNYLYRHVI